jgi:toxin ParE1/3/4
VTVVLSATAEQDLLEIYSFGARQFGVAQADKYALDLDHAMRRDIAADPLIGRSRPELGAGLRSINRGSHQIFYRPFDEGVFVMRILHGRMDVKAQRFGV